MTVYSDGTYDLIGAGSTQTATLDPSATAVTFNLAGVFATFDIQSRPGAVVTVNNTVAVGNTLNLDTNGGSIILDNNTFIAFHALGTVDVTIDEGGSFTVGSALITADVITGGTITFGTGGGTSVVGTANSFVTLSLLSAFSPYVGFTSSSDVIDDLSLKWTGATSYTITGTGSGIQTIVITQNGQTFSFETTGANLTDVTNETSLTAGPLKLSEDASGGTDITVCFARGTRLMTPTGQAPVETLNAGDMVATQLDGDTVFRPIKWLGWRRIDLTAHPRPHTVAPIRIQRGAFADNVPVNDLLLSPDHAVFIDGKLICARQLVNGATIRQETDRSDVEYFHVELDTHAILLSEGLPTESYLDTGNRGFFSNANHARVLHPDLTDESSHPARMAASCAPFVWAEDEVRPVWNRLAERAAAHGKAVAEPDGVTDPELCIVVRGQTQRPVAIAGGCYHFIVKSGVEEVLLVSRAASPSHMQPWLNDRRQLGVNIERIVLRRRGDINEIPVDHPGLSQGWWPVERDGTAQHRWTDGHAKLAFPADDRPAILEIWASNGGMVYATDTADRERAA
jgi:hypothetical protein